MGSRLSSLLVQEGFISLEALRDVLALQVIRGGQLDTILLEKKLCDEPTLLALLGRSTGYPPLEPATMRTVDPEASSVMPITTADKLGVCPVAFNDQDVLLLVDGSADPVHLEELAFELGRRLMPLASTEVRLLHARGQVYGTTLEPRFQRLLQRLGALPAAADVQIAEGVVSLPVLTPHIQPRKRAPTAQLSTQSAPAATPPPGDHGYQILGPTASHAPAPVEQPPALPKDITDEFPPLLAPGARPAPSTPEEEPRADAANDTTGPAAPTVDEPVDAPTVDEPTPTEPAPTEPATVEMAAVEMAAVEMAAVEMAAVEMAAVEMAAVEMAAVEMAPASVEAGRTQAEPAHPPLGMPPIPSDAEEPAPPDEPHDEMVDLPDEELLPDAGRESEAAQAPRVTLATEATESSASPEISLEAELPDEDSPSERPIELHRPAPVEVGPIRFGPGPLGTVEATSSEPRRTGPLSQILRPDVRSVVVSGELRTVTSARRRERVEDSTPTVVIDPEQPSDLTTLEQPADRGAEPTAAEPAADPSFTEGITVRLPVARRTAAQSADHAAPPGPGAAPGPLSIEDASSEVAGAKNRDEVLLALARGVRAQLECVQIYVVRQGVLRGHLELLVDSIDWSLIKARRLDLGLPSVISRAVEEGSLFIGPAPDTDSSPSVLISGGILALRGICLLPITLRGKTVCLLAGHNYDQPLSQRLRGPLTRLAEEASSALAALILRRKGGEPPKRHAPAQADSTAEPFEALPPAMDTQAPAEQGAASDDFDVPDLTLELPPDPMWPETPTARMPVRPQRAMPPDGYSFDSVTSVAETVTIPDLSTAVAAARHLEQEALSTLPGLLARLERGGSDASEAETAVVRLSTPALNLLVNQFPGSLRIDRSTAERELPPVWECSGVLRAIMAFGRHAVPAIAPLFHHRDPQVRFFAAYLMSELVYPEGVSLLATCLQDPDPGVRRIAAHVLWRFKEMEQFPDVLLDLRTDLSSPNPRPRRAAVDAVAALGDAGSVPKLVVLLEDADPGVSEAAYDALVVLTKQDFALNTGKWTTWWEANRTRPRLLWLVDGLVHGTPEIRASAAVDLEELTGLSFGYRHDLPQREREAVRRRFLEWWAEAGRFRFART